MLSRSRTMPLIFTHCSHARPSTSGVTIRQRPLTNRNGLDVLDMYVCGNIYLERELS